MYIPDNYDLFEQYERDQERIERRHRRLEAEDEMADFLADIERDKEGGRGH